MKFTSSLEKVKRDGGAHSAGRKPLALKKTVAERAGGGHSGPIALKLALSFGSLPTSQKQLD